MPDFAPFTPEEVKQLRNGDLLIYHSPMTGDVKSIYIGPAGGIHAVQYCDSNHLGEVSDDAMLKSYAPTGHTLGRLRGGIVEVPVLAGVLDDAAKMGDDIWWSEGSTRAVVDINGSEYLRLAHAKLLPGQTLKFQVEVKQDA